jgi:hypothetical protein
VAGPLQRGYSDISSTATMAANSYLTAIKNGELKAYRPAGSFEATTRKNGERRDIYARYIGENGEHR